MRRLLLLACVAAMVPASAAAQSFPADDAWVPLTCRDGVMTDAYRDEPVAVDERDLVGDPAGPTGLRALDADFLYLRLRLDDDAAAGGALRPFAWGFELDSDGDYTTYEVLIAANGIDEEITVYQNTVTTLPDDPTDPADEPPIATYPFATHGRSAVAATTFGGDPDAYLDFAVAWSDLAQVGLDPSSVVTAWAASSSSKSSLDGDFACHDGSSGDPVLSDIASDPTTIDPSQQDTDGDGYTDQTENGAGTDPTDPNSHPGGDPDAPLLEGGGGCAVAGGGDAATLALVLAALALLLTRTSRAAAARTPSRRRARGSRSGSRAHRRPRRARRARRPRCRRPRPTRPGGRGRA